MNAILPSVIDTPANRASLSADALAEGGAARASIAAVVAFLLQRRRRRGDRRDRPRLRLGVTPARAALRAGRGCRRSTLPGELAALYGGSLGFDEPRVFANFVADDRRRRRDPVGAARRTS